MSKNVDMSAIAFPKEKDKLIETKKPKYVKSPELISRVLHSLEIKGLSLRKSCQKEGLTDGTFLGWVNADEDLAKRYARALSIRNERMAEELLDIADDVTEDDIFDENGNRKANNEWIHRSKLRIDTRKWLLSKMMPKKFGDRLEVDNKGEIGLNVTIKQYTEIEDSKDE